MKYKIVAPKKFLIIFLVLAVLAAGGFFAWKKFQKNQLGKELEPQETIYEAMIQTKGQDKYDNPEDRKTFFENGDVLVIFPAGHTWTAGERGETIVKLKIKPEEAEKLMESVTEEVSSTGSELKGSGQDPSTSSGQGGEEKMQEIVVLRKYHLKMNKLDLEDKEKEYEWKVVEEKDF